LETVRQLCFATDTCTCLPVQVFALIFTDFFNCFSMVPRHAGKASSAAVREIRGSGPIIPVPVYPQIFMLLIRSSHKPILGTSIIFLESQGGTIEAWNLPKGGLQVVITLKK
jgi:hypothetical protein